MNDVLIWLFSSLAILAALLLVLTRSILYGAYFLVICLLSLASLYVLLQAEFVGVTQLMIYVGGIIILLIFAIMLTRKVAGKVLLTVNYNRFYALLLFLAAGLVMGSVALSVGQGISAEVSASGDIENLGIRLMTTYLLPMELMAILLLLVLIGALNIAGDNFRKGVDHE